MSDQSIDADMFTRLWPKVVQYFSRRGDRDPEDLAAETFLQVVRTGAVNDGYVWNAARYVRLHAWERQQTRPQLTQIEPTGTVSLDFSLAMQAEDALALLTPLQQRVVSLTADGYSTDEVARLVQSNATNVKGVRKNAVRRAKRLTAALALAALLVMTTAGVVQ